MRRFTPLKFSGKKMFAIVETGGKQYKVEQGSVITVEKLETEAGKSVTLDKVVMVADGEKLFSVDAAKKATVNAEVVEHKKADKVIIFKKNRRHNYRRKNGHRQQQTILKVTAINA